jgi:hypothetical protein
MSIGHRHNRRVVRAIIGLRGLRSDGQNHCAQHRERSKRERRFHPYRADAAFCAEFPVGVTRQH